MERQEHVEWCKKRAMEYVDSGDLINAVTSMLSDMSKHSDCDVPAPLAYAAMMFEIPRGADAVRRWINGFN